MDFYDILDVFLSENTQEMERMIKSTIFKKMSNEDKNYLLHYTCQEGKFLGTKILLENNVDVNMMDKEGFSPLYIASGAGYNSIVELLLNHGAFVNITNASAGYTTPLQIAAAYGHFDIVKTLIKYNADINLINDEDDSASTLAKKYGHDEIAEYLEKVM